MISSTLWAEVTISGFIFLLAAMFLALKALGIGDLSFLDDIKDYTAVVGVGAIATSYILGVLFHRLFSMLGKTLSPRVRLWLGLGIVAEDNEYGRADRARVAILQYGSERLLREIDFQFNFLALFSQLAVALPLLGICAAVWLADTAQARLAIPVLVIGLLLGLGFVVVRASQRRTYRALKNDAYLEVAAMRKGPPREG